jgi:hypothetical protein
MDTASMRGRMKATGVFENLAKPPIQSQEKKEKKKEMSIRYLLYIPI